MKYFVYAVIIIVAAAVIAGFFIVGSPRQERLRHFDERRVSDLQFIQSEIVNYWQNKGKMPENLSNLKDNIRGIIDPKDPETGAGYVYEIKNAVNLNFVLCATFSKAATPMLVVPYGAENWQHSAGKVCFDRTIDKEIYKFIKEPPRY